MYIVFVHEIASTIPYTKRCNPDSASEIHTNEYSILLLLLVLFNGYDHCMLCLPRKNDNHITGDTFYFEFYCMEVAAIILWFYCILFLLVSIRFSCFLFNEYATKRFVYLFSLILWMIDSIRLIQLTRWFHSTVKSGSVEFQLEFFIQVKYIFEQKNNIAVNWNWN